MHTPLHQLPVWMVVATQRTAHGKVRKTQLLREGLTHTQAMSLTVFCRPYYNSDVVVAVHWLRA